MLHEVIIIALQSKLKLFDENGQVLLYGESKAIVDEDKTWQRIVDNLNIEPPKLSLLVLYDKLTDALMIRILKFFSGVNSLRLMDIKSLATCLSLLHREKNFVLCGAVARFNKLGELSCEYTEETSIGGLTKLSFKEIFSQEKTLRELKKSLMIKENQLKTLRKEMNR